MKITPLLRGPIALRLFLFNCLLIFVPVAGFLSFEAYEKALLKQQEHAMVQEGRTVAAWLGSRAFSAESAAGVIASLGQAHTSRIRIISKDHALLADSSSIETGAGNGEREGAKGSSLYDSRTKDIDVADAKAPQATLLYRILRVPVRLWRKYALPPQPPLETADWYASSRRFDGPEIEAALKGRYGSTTRVSGGQSSITLYSALPVTANGEVHAVVLVSQSTWRILTELYTLRLAVGRIFLYSLLAAIFVSMILALTISRPLSRLEREARELESRGRGNRAAFTGSGRGDEIDELAKAFTALVARLDERLDWAVRFSADASHELKNPLAGIRATAELLETGDPAADRLPRSIQAACSRMEASLNGLRALSLLERPLEGNPGTPVAQSLAGLALRYPDILLQSQGLPESLEIAARAEQFDCALTNLIENALSFSSEPGSVRVIAVATGREVQLLVEDRGPGIPEENLERIFDRFFSARKGDGGRSHAGLGLALVKAIAEASGGSVVAQNREDGGARFTLRFPTKA